MVQDIKITPSSGTPQILFRGSGTSDTAIELNVVSQSDTALSFEGTEGQLFSITNNLSSGALFRVNDIAGLPIIEADASGDVKLAEYGRYVGVGTGVPSYLLDVFGTGNFQTIRFSDGTTQTTAGGGGGGVTASGTSSGVAFFGGDGNLTSQSNFQYSSGNRRLIFTGSGASDNPINLDILSQSDTALSFEGTEGQLFSITNNLSSGALFRVNDIAGLPIIEADASGDIKLAEYGRYVGVGTGVPVYLLDVFGTGNFQAIRYPDGTTQITAEHSGTPNSLVFLGGDGKLADDPSLTFDSGNNTITFLSSGVGDTAIDLDIVSRLGSASGTTLSFEGTEGQLFSVVDNLSAGTIFSVSDISGLPLIEADASGDVKLAEYGRFVGVGTGVPSYLLDVFGTGNFQTIRFSDGTTQTTAGGGGGGGVTASGTPGGISFFGGDGNLTDDPSLTFNSGDNTITFLSSGVGDTAIDLDIVSRLGSASGTTLSFEGTEGQLFSVVDNLSEGVIFSVSDISGLPLIEADASGDVKIGEYGRYTGVGTGVPVHGLDVSTSYGRNVVSLTHASAASYTVTDTDNVIIIDQQSMSDVSTVNLPAASSSNRRILTFKNISSTGGEVTLDGNSSETIDGTVTYSLPNQHDASTIICDGSNWFTL